MNRNYIESILNSTSMIYTISRKKIQCSHTMNEFYFFKIFIEAFRTVDIELTIEDKPEVSFGYISKSVLVDRKEIVFWRDTEILFTAPFNMIALNDKIREYNHFLKGMGFMESTLRLIDIFKDLLG